MEEIFDIKTQLIMVPISIIASVFIGWGMGYIGNRRFPKNKEYQL